MHTEYIWAQKVALMTFGSTPTLIFDLGTPKYQFIYIFIPAFGPKLSKNITLTVLHGQMDAGTT